MPRAARFTVENGTYHVMTRGESVKIRNALIFSSFIPIIILLHGCVNMKNSKPKSKTGDDFYDYYSGSRSIKVFGGLALKKPYFISDDDTKGERWTIYNKKQISEVVNVNRFEISSDYCYGKTYKERYSNSIEPAYYFIFIMNTNIKKYKDQVLKYKTEKEFIKALKKINIAPRPLKAPEEHYKEFWDTGRCHWFPPPISTGTNT